MRDIKFIFIHCTATTREKNISDIRQIFKGRGWKRSGYHYIIDGNGRIWNEVTTKYASNGVRGYNTNAINIAYIGGIDNYGNAKDTRNEKQITMLRILVKSLLVRFPSARVMGHRDIWGKDPHKWLKQCPCFDVDTQL